MLKLRQTTNSQLNWRRKMASAVLETLANDFAAIAEAAGKSVVAIYGRRWMPSSGIQWRKGVMVTADHTIRRAEDITVVLEGGRSTKASLAGRDPSTDLAILKTPGDLSVPVPEFADGAQVRLAHLVLALGRSRSSHLVASAGIIGGLSGEWRPRRGGRVEQHIRLDLELYPGFSGGPLLNAHGQVIGINTHGLTRGRPVTLPNSTVNRIVDELLEKGHIARPYLGLAMQPVAVPESLRSKVSPSASAALLVVHVEPSGPAEKAGFLLGDVVIEVDGKPVEDTGDIQELLASAKIGTQLNATVLRGGAPLKLSVKLEDRPAR
jgi:S1-C subfamily serine protease